MTLLGNEFGEVEVWDYMSEGKPWEHCYVEAFSILDGHC